MERVAIVGAGAAGAAVAFALEDTADVSVFEARDALSGRAATRRQAGCIYDYGANYVRSDDVRVSRLVSDTLNEGLVDIGSPVWTFNADGDVGPGEDRDDHKWTWKGGVDQLAERLLARSSATVELETPVKAVVRVDGGWQLQADGAFGSFDAVVLTPPAPQVADLLATSDWDHPLRERLVEATREIHYRSIHSVMLHYPFELERPWYALVNTDREHEIGWLSREECKPGHVPDGETLLVVQMAPGWTAEDDPAAKAAAATAQLLGDDRLAMPDWKDEYRWQYALPDAGVDEGLIRSAEGHGLYCAGDWVAGEGRVHLAVRTGLDVGDRLTG